ncbi:uncharacterized protein TrAFT101_004692 [Trichoderma asperellum]|uniref:uncharacterized protein n=1 Tax=Trichoderma asperellum TaxID=101201 RepID=UPI00332CE6E9|nr:hypothetical protein TrAFT101_004692 [Trichoderma asperellum]
MLSSPPTMKFSFMDDSYIMMRSNAWEKDCEKIAKVHNLLNSWAEENGVSFAPEKYSLFSNTKLGTVKIYRISTTYFMLRNYLRKSVWIFWVFERIISFHRNINLTWFWTKWQNKDAI